MNGTNGNGRIRFDDVEVDAARRLLRVRGEIVPLNGKAFDLLAVLVENRGRLVPKDELLDLVWADQFVEENNLTVQISALRKALGEKKGEHRYILTVPGKGYEFVGELNGNGHEELIVESREIKRIVIDELVEDSRPVAFATSRKTVTRWLVAAVGFVVLVGAGWFGFGKYIRRDEVNGALYSARRFLTTGVPQRVAISPDGKTIAYTRRLKGLDSVWLGDIASGTSIQLTDESHRLHEMLEFSPDGRTLYLSARDENHPEWTLISISTFGGAAKDLVKGVRYFSISNDGKLVAYFKASDGKAGLHVADAETGRDERLIYQPVAPRKFALEKASWSPSRNAVAVALTDASIGADCDLYEIDAVNGREAKLGTNLCSKAANFAWVKDGSGIALTGKLSDASTGRDAWLADAETWNLRRLTAVATSFGQYSLSTAENGRLAVLEGRNLPNISSLNLENGSSARLFEGTSRGEGAYGVAAAPDGTLIFTVRVDDDLTIWEMAGDGSAAHQLFPGQKDADDVQPNVTPDNKFIVFESDRSGSPEIWRANRDGSDQLQLTNGGENSSPSITPDGQFVLYSAKRDGNYDIWRIPVAGGKPEGLTNTGCSWPDPSPNGKYFACATGTAADWHRRKIMIYPINGGESVRSLDVAFNSALYNRMRWSPDSRSVIYKDEVEGLWKQGIEGGEPQRIPGFTDVRVFHFGFDADGKMLVSGGMQMRQIVILDPPTNSSQIP